MYIYGKNVAIEELKKENNIEKIYLYKNFKEIDILKEIERKRIKTEYLEKYELDKMVKGNHQGIILKVKDFEYNSLDELLNTKNPLVVILDHIEDPHNFGAIIRTCEAAGVTGIIIPKDRSVEVNSTVIKVSTGAINGIKIVQVTNLVRTIEELKKHGFWIIGTDMEGTDYTEIDYSGSTAIVIGNEGKGMSRMVEENCDFIASIPMLGKTNSLNASVSTGIIVFEAVRKRR